MYKRQLVISDGIEVIDHQAAKANPYLKKIHLGRDVQYIGPWAFAYNKRLQKVTGGENVRFVGRCAVSYTHLDVYKRQRWNSRLL